MSSTWSENNDENQNGSPKRDTIKLAEFKRVISLRSDSTLPASDHALAVHRD
jgi:hypothetical protein